MAKVARPPYVMKPILRKHIRQFPPWATHSGPREFHAHFHTHFFGEEDLSFATRERIDDFLRASTDHPHVQHEVIKGMIAYIYNNFNHVKNITFFAHEDLDSDKVLVHLRTGWEERPAAEVIEKATEKARHLLFIFVGEDHPFLKGVRIL